MGDVRRSGLQDSAYTPKGSLQIASILDRTLLNLLSATVECEYRNKRQRHNYANHQHALLQLYNHHVLKSDRSQDYQGALPHPKASAK